jgi:diketogulonate reductase-like aldo/keto reductase
METYTLWNGTDMPVIGYGMWKNKKQEEVTEGIKDAINIGFRHIDSAAAYQNEELVGKGLAASDFPREKLFITSKLKNKAHGYENVKQEVEETLNNLGTDYLDLYLIHWPVVKGHGDDWKEDNLDTWRAFEELYDEGVLKAIGVSNFSIEQLENLIKNARIKPMVNQLLVHPGVLQKETRDYCEKHDIVVQAYSPLSPLKELSEDQHVQEMATKYKKTIAQLLLRFDLQLGVVPLTKSVHRERIEENFDIFDFEIDADDMNYLKAWSHPDFTEPDNKNERPPQVS